MGRHPAEEQRDGRGRGGLRSHSSAYPATYLWEHLPQRHSIGLAGTL